MPKIVEKKSGLIPQIDKANSHHYSKLTLKDLEEAFNSSDLTGMLINILEEMI